MPVSTGMTILVQCFAGALMVLAGVASAADRPAYPSKPIRFIVTFAPGGGTDVFARAIAQKFTETWGQPVIVDNRAGGNGNIGTDLVASGRKSSKRPARKWTDEQYLSM